MWLIFGMNKIIKEAGLTFDISWCKSIVTTMRLTSASSVGGLSSPATNQQFSVIITVNIFRKYRHSLHSVNSTIIIFIYFILLLYSCFVSNKCSIWYSYKNSREIVTTKGMENSVYLRYNDGHQSFVIFIFSVYQLCIRLCFPFYHCNIECQRSTCWTCVCVDAEIGSLHTQPSIRSRTCCGVNAVALKVSIYSFYFSLSFCVSSLLSHSFLRSLPRGTVSCLSLFFFSPGILLHTNWSSWDSGVSFIHFSALLIKLFFLLVFLRIKNYK